MNRVGQLLVTSAMCLIAGATPQQERPPVRTITPSPRMYEAPRVVKDDDTPPAPPSRCPTRTGRDSSSKSCR